MKQARLSERAQADLIDIWLDIAQDDSDAADRLVDRILGTCQRLARTPRIGRARENLGPGLRSLSFERYPSSIGW